MRVKPLLGLLLARGRDRLETLPTDKATFPVAISYSLGDAIDWKQLAAILSVDFMHLLLARGRDRLET